MKTNKNLKDIVQSIGNLLEELSAALDLPGNKELNTTKTVDDFSGPSGGVRMLLAADFFKEPKPLPDVVKRLHQEGFNYRRQVISTALLRSVRNRILVRRPGDGGKQWVYSERK